MILSEKLNLSEKLVLCEAVTADLQTKLISTIEKAKLTLLDLAKQQNNDKSRQSSDDAAKALVKQITKAKACLDTDASSDNFKKEAVANFRDSLKNFDTSSISDTKLQAQINDCKNSFDALMSANLDDSVYEEAKDKMNSMQTALMMLTRHMNSGNVDDDHAVNTSYEIMKQASKAAKDPATTLSDTDITALISAIDNLVAGIAKESEIPGKVALCAEFNKSFGVKYDDAAANAKDTLADRDDEAALRDQADKDWGDEYSRANSREKSAVWDRFIKAVFPKDVNKVSKLAPAFEHTCATYGFTETSNPFITFVKEFIIKKDLPAGYNSFTLIIEAMKLGWLSPKSLTTDDDPSSEFNVIKCRDFYRLSKTDMRDMLGRQHDLTNAPSHDVNKKGDAKGRLTKVFLAANLSDPSTVEGSAKLTAAILYDTSTLSGVDVTTLKFRGIGDIKEIVALLFGQEFAIKSYSTTSSADASNFVSKVIIGGGKDDPKKAVSNLIKWLFYLDYGFNDGHDTHNDEVKKIFTPDTEENNAIVGWGDERKVFTAYLEQRNTLKENPKLEAAAKSQLKEHKIKVGMVEKLVPVILRYIVKFKQKMDKES